MEDTVDIDFDFLEEKMLWSPLLIACWYKKSDFIVDVLSFDNSKLIDPLAI